MVYHVLVADRNPYKQSHRRTIKGDIMDKHWKKSLSWNAIAFIITTGTCYLITGKIEIAGTIALVERAIKVIVYSYHEKLWEGV